MDIDYRKSDIRSRPVAGEKVDKSTLYNLFCASMPVHPSVNLPQVSRHGLPSMCTFLWLKKCIKTKISQRIAQTAFTPFWRFFDPLKTTLPNHNFRRLHLPRHPGLVLAVQYRSHRPDLNPPAPSLRTSSLHSMLDHCHDRPRLIPLGDES